MPNEAASPTPNQLWDKAAKYLEANETEGAQNSLLHWALMLDPAVKAAWLDRLPPQLFNAVSSIVRTSETLSDNPNDTALTWISIGRTWLDRNQPDWAHACFVNAAAAAPENDSMYHELGLSWHRKNEPGQALNAFKQAANLNPNHASTWHNLGQCHQQLGQASEACEAFEKALAIEPGHPLAGVELGAIRLGNLDLPGAEACLSSVIEQHPDEPAARRNRAQVLLLQGRFQQGWIDFGYRFQTGTREHYSSDTLWRGEPIGDKKLLIHFEQGLGDTIMFSRFLPQVQSLCRKLVFECQPTLITLLRQSFPAIEIVAEGDASGNFDVHLPLLSLGERLGLNESNLLSDHPCLVATDRDPLPGTGRLKVGLAWAGNPHHAKDASRSIAWESFAKLTCVNNVDYFSLQVGPRANDCRDSGVISIGDQLTDCAATAAVIQQLDLVITVDTAVAHLAGALGKPTWVLVSHVPDWRWQLNRTDCLWYPVVELHRQRRTEDDWQATLERVKQALAKRLT
ncbi:MAG: tetratricopeptide repeat protein [Verrucomicrobiota bacterium]|nr:tetratricopeptide repeat protein [Verrucomicrobiota bacterium]